MSSPVLPLVGAEPEGAAPTLTRYAWLSIAAAVATIALKSSAYLLTGSVGLLADAAESLVNLVAAGVALIALKVAARPADDNHHYGHGKAEYFSAGMEGLMIFVAAAVIIITSVDRFLHPQPLESVGLGLVVSSLGSVINLAVGLLLIRRGRQHRSVTLEADGKHLMTDVWTSVGVLVGVALVAITGIQRLDPVVAVVVGLNILITGFRLVASAAVALLDVALPAEDDAALQQVLTRFRRPEVDITQVRTRQSGRHRFVSLTLVVPGEWTVRRGHDLADELEGAIADALPMVAVQTHLEPAPAADSVAATDTAG